MSEGYNTYVSYLALKKHFSSDYNYFKYNGRVRASEASFNRRRDRYTFGKIERNYKDKAITYLIGNVIADSEKWIGDFTDENYAKWVKNKRAQEYLYNEDLSKIQDYLDAHDLTKPSDLFKAENNDHPLLLRLFLSNVICINTMCILDIVFDYVPIWERTAIDPLMRKKIALILNTKGFLSIDKRKYTLLSRQCLFTS